MGLNSPLPLGLFAVVGPPISLQPFQVNEIWRQVYSLQNVGLTEDFLTGGILQPPSEAMETPTHFKEALITAQIQLPTNSWEASTSNEEQDEAEKCRVNTAEALSISSGFTVCCKLIAEVGTPL